MKFTDKLYYYFKKHWIRMVVCFVFGIAVMCIYNASRGDWQYLTTYSNGLFIGGILLISIGFLTIINNYGGFDLLQFNFSKRKYTEEGKRETYYDYMERKKKTRKISDLIFLDYFIFGALYCIVSAILLAI